MTTQRSSSSVIQIMHDRVWKKNKNVILFVVGPTGSGKSWASLRIGECLDPNFTIENVCFGVRELIEKSQDAKKGTCLVFDEAGIDASNRSSMTKLNKAVSSLAQTFRHRNTFNILTLPVASMTDVHLRVLAHYVMETINITNNQCITKFKYIQVNPLTSTIYRKYLFDTPGTQITRVKVNKPSQHLIDPYEARKAEFTSKLYNSLMSKTDPNAKKEEKPKKNSVAECIEIVLNNPVKFIDYKKNGKAFFSKRLIRQHCGVGETYAEYTRQAMASDHKYLLDEAESGSL